MYIDKWFTLNEKTDKALYFHKKFSLCDKPKKVVLTLSSLGWVKAFINGGILTDDEFLFGWRDYTKSVGYKEYDITKYIETNNAIGVIAGKGWACGQIGWGKFKKYYDLPNPCIFVKIKIFYDEHTEVLDDNDWKVGFGSIIYNDIFDGETQDYNQKLNNFSNYFFNDRSFKNADLFYRKLYAVKEKVSVILQEYLKANLVKNYGKRFVFDFKQNFSGFVQIKCTVKQESHIVVRHAEILGGNFELYTENLRGVKATEHYVLPVGEYVLRPYFTYHGFRYCEVSIKGNVEIQEVVGCVAYAKMRKVGDFYSSNLLLNQIYHNITWSQKSNFNKIPTDCPQRDERLGWLADIGVFSRSASYNYDCKKYLENYISIVSEAIDENGAIPCIVPFTKGIVDNAMGASGWADSYFSLIDDYYEMYGNDSLIKKYFSNMTRFLSWIENNSAGYKRNTYCFSDWLSVNSNYEEGFGDVEPTLFDLCYYAIDCLYIIKFCKILNISAKIYIKKYNKSKQFFLTHYSNKLSSLSGKQCSLLLSYRARFVSKKNISKLLAEDIEKNGMTCGFIGTKLILQTLSDMGRGDLCYKLLTSKNYPSWGYSIVNGATTIWERWDSYIIGDGVNKHGMNSFNHFAFGSILEWFYSGILGINSASFGFKNILIRPIIDFSGKVTFANGKFIVNKKKLRVSWKICDNLKKEVIYIVNYKMVKEIHFDFSNYIVKKSMFLDNKAIFILSKK